ncbi:MAG: O-antigen ligase family protein [Flagellimonas sp.]
MEPTKALDLLLKQATILVFPIILNHRDLEQKNLNTVNSVFFYGIFIYICYLYFVVFLKFIELGRWYELDPVHPTWKYYFYTTGRLSPDIHPTFLSMFIVYCINGQWKRIKNVKFGLRKAFYYFIMIVLIITTLLLSSRGALLSLFMVFVLYQITRIFKGQSKGIIYLAIIILIGAGIYSNTGTFNRVSKLKNVHGKSLVEIANISNSTGKRVQIYLIAKDVVKDNFWTGIGTKNWQLVNRHYYNINHSDDFEYFIDTLNTHNQYLNALVCWGVIGLLLFIIIVVLNIYFGKTDVSVFLFWCFMAILLFTENILNRHRGVVFFSIVSAFTINQYLGYRCNFKKSQL